MIEFVCENAILHATACVISRKKHKRLHKAILKKGMKEHTAFSFKLHYVATYPYKNY